MKKILIVLVLLFSSISLFGQTKQETLINANGHDWTSWAPQQQYAWVFGFVYAMETVRTVIYNDTTINRVDKDRYLKYLYFCCIEDVGSAIDYYYKTYPDNLDATIWSVVLLMYKKHWWEIEEPTNSEDGGIDTEENRKEDIEEMFEKFQEIDPRFNPSDGKTEYSAKVSW